MKYLMKLRYVGTNFSGYQIQPNTRTVQGELNSAFRVLFGEGVKVTSCSRTDAGVHANASSLTVELPDGNTPIEPEKLPIAANHQLPNDVAVYDCSIVDDEFHVRHDVKKKEYLYRIWNARTNNPFEVNRAWFYPQILNEEQIRKMNEAAKHLIGTHDFASFQAQGSPVATTIRTLDSISVTKEGEVVSVRVSADGFLYNMVRIIVGTLIDVAQNRISVDEIPQILESKNRAKAGQTAPPEGLYLNHVYY